MSGEGLVLAGLLSIATGSMAFTLSEASIFAGLRARMNQWSKWLGKLLSCGYCISHWVAFPLVAIYRPRLFLAWWPLDYFLTALTIAWAAAFQWVALVRLMQRAGK